MLHFSWIKQQYYIAFFVFLKGVTNSLNPPPGFVNHEEHEEKQPQKDTKDAKKNHKKLFLSVKRLVKVCG